MASATVLSLPGEFEPIVVAFNKCNKEWAARHLPECRMAFVVLRHTPASLRQSVRILQDADILKPMLADMDDTREHLIGLVMALEEADRRLRLVSGMADDELAGRAS